MNFDGRWLTSFGPMTLMQDGARVHGTYGREGTENTLEGTATADELTFQYAEAREKGTGRFKLKRYGTFVGEYVADSNRGPYPWQGWRGFEGLWDTQLGRLRFIQEESGQVVGFAEYDAAVRLEGRVEGRRLSFKLDAAKFAGRGTLELDAVSHTASGEWLEEGQPVRELIGYRVLPRQGLTWLIVLEAHWQRAFDDAEYAFGHMLRELFARVPRVQVRHRIYHDESSLLHWCRQLLFLAEPAVLIIAGHGETSGLSVYGRIIPLRRVVDALRLADTLKVMHFSSCLVGQDDAHALSEAPFPVSCYRTSVDWAQSALTEFIYLDMILEKGLPPAAAAEQLVSLVRFAGTEDIPGSPYRPADFCFFG